MGRWRKQGNRRKIRGIKRKKMKETKIENEINEKKKARKFDLECR